MLKYILGVKIDDLSMPEALELVSSWLDAKRQAPSAKQYIVTPNPEFVMSAQKDPEFREILNKADLSIPDGVGLRLGGVTNIVPGVDFMQELCRKAAGAGWSVGFFGGQDAVAKKCAEVLQTRYPGLKISFAESGGEVDSDGRSSIGEERSVTISDTQTDILFVALGHIKQEKWIRQNMKTTPAKVFMGVGGAFDYIAGIVPRAPLWMRKIGLEWLFRLLIQPWRLKRQLSLLKFVLSIYKNRNGSGV